MDKYKKGFRLDTYVPISHIDVVKKALADAGAGKIGNYDSCMWQTLGTGQFRPLEGSNPFIGSHELLEKVEEFKIELICDEHIIDDVINALKSSHPYETVAFQFWPVYY